MSQTNISAPTPIIPARFLPPLALLAGASVWGVIWYPYRLTNQAGLDGLWSTALTYGTSLVVATALFGGRWREAPPRAVATAPARGRGRLEQPRLCVGRARRRGDARAAAFLPCAALDHADGVFPAGRAAGRERRGRDGARLRRRRGDAVASRARRAVARESRGMAGTRGRRPVRGGQRAGAPHPARARGHQDARDLCRRDRRGAGPSCLEPRSGGRRIAAGRSERGARGRRGSRAGGDESRAAVRHHAAAGQSRDRDPALRAGGGRRGFLVPGRRNAAREGCGRRAADRRPRRWSRRWNAGPSRRSPCRGRRSSTRRCSRTR